jgi:hypothetical protein
LAVDEEPKQMPGEQRRSHHVRDVLLAFDHDDPYVGQGGCDVD